MVLGLFLIVIACFVLFQWFVLSLALISCHDVPLAGGDGPRVLIVSMMDANGGGEFYALSLYRTLLQQNPNIRIIVAKNSFLEKKLTELRLPFF
jgi:hypothetical protein